jgi:transcriptional regulator with XRE-family HTH domain
MENLKEKREDRKLTQIDCAKSCGVSLSSWRMWEAGVTKPKPENLEKIEQLLLSCGANLLIQAFTEIINYGFYSHG